jgi:hypothetical protein
MVVTVASRNLVEAEESTPAVGSCRLRGRAAECDHDARPAPSCFLPVSPATLLSWLWIMLLLSFRGARLFKRTQRRP